MVKSVVQSYFGFGGANCLPPEHEGQTISRRACSLPQICKYFHSPLVSVLSAGIRLENNVLITKVGIQTLTNVPRDIEDVERVLAGGEWPNASATAAPV